MDLLDKIRAQYDLDDLTRQLTAFPDFGAMIDDSRQTPDGRVASSYRPTMRIDIDTRYAVLARAYDDAQRAKGDERRAWTPIYDHDRRSRVAFDTAEDAARALARRTKATTKLGRICGTVCDPETFAERPDWTRVANFLGERLRLIPLLDERSKPSVEFQDQALLAGTFPIQPIRAWVIIEPERDLHLPKAATRGINWGGGSRGERVLQRIQRAMSDWHTPEPPAVLGGSWNWDTPRPRERYEDYRARSADTLKRILDAAANWLRPGQPIRIVYDPPRLDGRKSYQGREGTIHRLCFMKDLVYVHLPKTGRERQDRVEMINIARIEPL